MFKEIIIEHQGIKLRGHVSYTAVPRTWVVFAHGSGSSHKSPRNNWVASELNAKGFGTFLFDLLTVEEDLVYENRFNIPLLAERLLLATQWLMKSSDYQGQPIAFFGASTGAGAALLAAARAPKDWPLCTVISRGGRPDLAGEINLKKISIPVLLIIGSLDDEVIKLNKLAENELKYVRLSLVPGATHLFEEPGTLAQVVHLSSDWLSSHGGSYVE